MIEIRKAVYRRTVGECQSVRRKIVVAFEPGDVIAFREHGRRRWYRAPITRLFVTVAAWNVAAEKAEKKAQRKAATT